MSKRYWELSIDDFPSGTDDGLWCGVSGFPIPSGTVYTIGQDSSSASYAQDFSRIGSFGILFHNDGNVGFMPSYDMGETLCFALDDAANLWWGRLGASGQWNGSGSADPATGVGGISLTPNAGQPYVIASTMEVTAGSGQITMNAGASAFVGALPSGYSAWDTTGATTWNSGFNPTFTYSNGDLTIETASASAQAGVSVLLSTGRRPTSVSVNIG